MSCIKDVSISCAKIAYYLAMFFVAVAFGRQDQAREIADDMVDQGTIIAAYSSLTVSFLAVALGFFYVAQVACFASAVCGHTF